jgi:hypothetical protein
LIASSESALVNVTIAPLVVAYASSSDEGWYAWIELVLMIAPPSRISGKAALQSQNMAYRLVLRVWCHSADEIPSMPSRVIWYAALLTRTSSWPNSATARSTHALALPLLGDIARNGDAGASAVANHASSLLRIAVLVQIRDQYVSTLACEPNRNRATDAAVAAGDDRLLTQEATTAAVRVLAKVGLRPHVGPTTGICLGLSRIWWHGFRL